MSWNIKTDTDTDTDSLVYLLLELSLISLNEFSYWFCSFSNGNCNLGKLIQISRLRKDTHFITEIFLAMPLAIS